MTCSLAALVADVLALMGETPPAAAAACFPGASPHEAICRKIAALLPGIGSTLIADADIRNIADAPELRLAASKRLMPSGGYAAVATLPADFLRPVAARLESPGSDARHIFAAGSRMTPRLWHPEAGIAGSPASPLAYIMAGSEGLQIWLMAADDNSDETLLLRCWSIPKPDAEDSFLFPGSLYAALTARLATELMQ